MTENKNDWEPAGFTLLKDTKEGRLIIEEDGYEYRLQRRKKEKVMPELAIGLGVEVENDWPKFVITRVGESSHIEAATENGHRKLIWKEQIKTIWDRGVEIWRRKG